MKAFPPSHGSSDRVELQSIKQLELQVSRLQGRSSSRLLRGAPPLRGRVADGVWCDGEGRRVSARRLQQLKCGAVLGAETEADRSGLSAPPWPRCIDTTPRLEQAEGGVRFETDTGVSG